MSAPIRKYLQVFMFTEVNASHYLSKALQDDDVKENE